MPLKGCQQDFAVITSSILDHKKQCLLTIKYWEPLLFRAYIQSALVSCSGHRVRTVEQWPSLPPCQNQHTSILPPIVLFGRFLYALRPEIISLHLGDIYYSLLSLQLQSMANPSAFSVQVTGLVNFRYLLWLKAEGRVRSFLFGHQYICWSLDKEQEVFLYLLLLQLQTVLCWNSPQCSISCKPQMSDSVRQQVQSRLYRRGGASCCVHLAHILWIVQKGYCKKLHSSGIHKVFSRFLQDKLLSQAP